MTCSHARARIAVDDSRRTFEASCWCGWTIVAPVRGRSFHQRALDAFGAVADAAYVQRRAAELAAKVLP